MHVYESSITMKYIVSYANLKEYEVQKMTVQME